LLVHDLLESAPGEAMRLALLSSHYRQPFDWTQRGLDDATKTLSSFYEIVADAKDDGIIDPEFLDALCDDLNTSRALTLMHAMAKAGRGADLKASAKLLGLLQDAETFHAGLGADVDVDLVEALLAERIVARDAKNWKESDRIRDELIKMGVTIKDTANGTEWSVK
jgi:cysteinyl-tRNA synthetase